MNLASIQESRKRCRLGHNHTIIPLVRRPPWLRLDTFPFALIYVSLIVIDMTSKNRANFTLREDGRIFEPRWQLLQPRTVHILFPLTLFLHVVLFLISRWNVKVEAFLGYRRSSLKELAKSLFNNNKCGLLWTHCMVTPPSMSSSSSSLSSRKKNEAEKFKGTGGAGTIEIVPVCAHRIRHSDDSSSWTTVFTISFEEIYFRLCIDDDCSSYEKMLNYSGWGADWEMDSIWGVDCRTNDDSPSKQLNKNDSSTASIPFHRLHFPIDLPLSWYTSKWTGHSSSRPTLTNKSTSLSNARAVYSDNTLSINLPPFFDLLSEQLLAPFFLFQVLCVALWSLDEYWYYAIFTLCTLIMFESTVAYNRLKSLQRLRETLRSPFYLWTYRNSRWRAMLSSELVVGDVVSLTGTGIMGALSNNNHDHEGGMHVPADMVLIRGGAVVNEAMLTGESVPQTKEQISTIVSSCEMGDKHGDDEEIRLDIEDNQHKRVILFGGTLLVNNTSPEEMPSTSEHENENDSIHGAESIPTAPDKGCIAIVLRTGFESQQGSLLRTMVHTSTKNGGGDGVNSKDTFIFVVLLLLCAIGSSILVLHHGWHDPTRNRFKLILHVIIIITNVVPPELPMELSLAVTSSVADLVKRCGVYCTEPFRIPLAGMVDTCCFDKTGTLTSDEMVLKGVRVVITESGDGTDSGTAAIYISDKLITPCTEKDVENNEEAILPNVLRVMVGCQGLARNPSSNVNKKSKNDEIIGDPLEKAVLSGCGWTLVNANTVAPLRNKSTSEYPQALSIKHRFAFSSKLKRMTVIASDQDKSDVFWSLTKGAPETLLNFLDTKTVPSNYNTISNHHMSLGQRVLAMGYKKLSPNLSNPSIWKKSGGRQKIERDLVFAGFLILDCPLKTDSARIVKDLKNSGHQVVMITGDAILTAAEVARRVGIVDRARNDKNDEIMNEIYELREVTTSKSPSPRNLTNNEEDTDFAFVPIVTKSNDIFSDSCMAYTSSNLKILKKMRDQNEISLCVTGDVLTKIAVQAIQKRNKNQNSADLNSIMDNKSVLLHEDSQSVLTNIVPLISVFARHAPRQKEAVIAALNTAGRVTMMVGDGTNDVGALKMAHVGISIVSVPDLEAKQRVALADVDRVREKERYERKKARKSKAKDSSSKKTKKNSTTVVSSNDRRKSMERSLRILAEAEEELSNVALGDASVASPFTSRTMSIKCAKDVLQRGRCTLVTMIQIYKILGVNSLVNALVLSSLHLVGAKQGDRQLTISGIVVAGLFFFVTKATPLEDLACKRPPSTILSRQALASIIVQFIVHFLCITIVTHISKYYLDSYDPSLVPDGPFNPNALNSTSFLMTCLALINTFVVNYRGRPFMENFSENKLLLRSVQLCYATLFICASEAFPPLNDLMQLAPLPTELLLENGNNKFESFDPQENLMNVLIEVTQNLGFKNTLCTLMIIDTIATFQGEKIIASLFDS